MPVNLPVKLPGPAPTYDVSVRRERLIALVGQRVTAGLPKCDRRTLLKAAAVLPVISCSAAPVRAAAVQAVRSVRPGEPGWPDPAEWAKLGRSVGGRLVKVNSPSYVNETDYFEDDWQTAFWGDHYARLQQVKARYDPGGLFFVHHGVGTQT